MRKLALGVFVVVFAALSAGNLLATQLACPTATTLDVLMTQTAGGLANACFSQDKLFYNFVYTPTGSAGPASSVQSALLFQQGTGLDIHGWNFSSNSWIQGINGPAAFTLGYTIQVCPSGSACFGNVLPFMRITGADAVYSPVSLFPAGNEVVNWSNGATATLTNSNGGPEPSTGNINVNSLGPISVSAAWTGTGGITQNTLRFYETTVPEPMSFVLIGTGLLGLGLLRRRARR
jgi:hypothetical protein